MLRGDEHGVTHLPHRGCHRHGLVRETLRTLRARRRARKSSHARFRIPALQIATVLEPIVREMCRRSPTFRRQLIRLADAPGLVVTVAVRRARPSSDAEATTRFAREHRRLRRADVEIGPADNASLVELIAHELEHVLEQLDDVNLTATGPRPRRQLNRRQGRSFETARARQIGLDVAAEFNAGVRRCEQSAGGATMKTRLAFGVLWLASARLIAQDEEASRRNGPPATCRGAPGLGDGRCQCRRAVRRLRVRGGARACRSKQERGHLCARPVNRSRDAGKRRHQCHRWRWDETSSTEWRRPVPGIHVVRPNLADQPMAAVAPQVLLRDRHAGTTTLVSRTLAGTPANGVSGHADISDDGGTIVFQSAATDLVDGRGSKRFRVRRLRVRCSFAQHRACERGRERGAADQPDRASHQS